MKDIDGIRGIPFDATQFLTPEGEYEYDNVYYSEDFAEWFRQYFSNGILIPGGTVLNTQLEVLKSGVSKVSIQPGAIIVAGRNGIIYKPYPVDLELAPTGYTRIDRVVIEMNEQDNRFNIKVVKGQDTTGKPVKPNITRESIVVGADTFEIYQMSLAAVTMGVNGVVSIEDERGNFDVCGLSKVVPSVEKPNLPSGDEASNIHYDNSTTKIPATTVQQALDELHSMNSKTDEVLNNKVKEFTAEIPTSGWKSSGSGYTLDLTVKGILASDNPIVDIVCSTEPLVARQQNAAWALIYKISAGKDKLVLYAEDNIESKLQVQIKVVR